MPTTSKYDRIQLWWDADNDPQNPGWCVTSWRDGNVQDTDLLTTESGEELPEDATDEEVRAAARRYLGANYDETVLEIER